jgi:Fe-S-cluster containining protein
VDRPDIMAWVVMVAGCGDLWISPKTGEEATRCPWLRKLPKQDRYICRIYDVRPDTCRDFPYETSVEHAQIVDCEMLPDEFRKRSG